MRALGGVAYIEFLAFKTTFLTPNTVEVIYDFKDELPNYTWVIGLLIIFLLRKAIQYYRSIEGTEKDNGKYSADYTVSGLYIIILLVWAVTLIIIYFSVIDFIILKKRYKNNTLQSVEGKVINYKASDCDRKPQQFAIKDTDFLIDDNYLYGYDKTNCDGNKITNGLYIRIHYTELHFKKVILKLEIKK